MEQAVVIVLFQSGAQHVIHVLTTAMIGVVIQLINVKIVVLAAMYYRVLNVMKPAVGIVMEYAQIVNTYAHIQRL